MRYIMRFSKVYVLCLNVCEDVTCEKYAHFNIICDMEEEL